ncbi:hypothetical protein A3C91_04025 [Candidatus Azambacteria bacterium RIFCSPHIGHO2_02_FULL_52_12]|uniref:CARDB domain-containing protein n=1 Tax=Candidatus Azambacteria bacterium RIFCSPLOWO2_01_FULL_46_25 TaxID=1797298 RepID=A0A1F5BUT7_9BACT|nr:MAG: hypothetical protein A3C91_04025 [Candidatus Azambacteria bacterium RIFCSPHIGHO2_02_FULL_52_12]OGD34395.1 MAG: hypothetical protein A2988_02610 [Candidatus Azambacteria bacterium RIFCSPLOWO2_01_FULL_46_25]OGD37327.1 MAG: hypothetical protein A2850_01280 [Candidatus Azambacteria bacterium RIFCSPHIGHO2_01_FULL_51_74]
MKKAVLFLLVFFALPAPAVFAGFGITPPYVKNESLTRNSHYEQKIILVRGDPIEDLKAEILIDVPNAYKWFSVDRGAQFILPKGEQQVPIIVSVNVPDSAEFGRYKGNIRITTTSLAPPSSGSVMIALGAQVDVDLNIIDKKIFDFKIRRISISDLNEGHWFWWMYFPGKIKFAMQLENTGNISITPSDVVFAIYDVTGNTLLETVHKLNAIQEVKPFETKEVIAELPTRLPVGSYRIKYAIYKEGGVAQEGELGLSVLPYGTLASDAGYGFTGLSARDKAIILSSGTLVIVGILYAFVHLYRRRKKKQ